MNPIKAILIDDEAHCIKTLQHLLAQQTIPLEVIATGGNGIEGMELIQQHQPDLIFVDIQMPYLNGLDMLEKLGPINSQVIFTTAFDAYAIKAIKLNALDYLLKPIDKTELNAALQKYLQAPQQILQEQVRAAQELQKGKVPEIIAISSNSGLEFIKINQIILMEADSCYTNIYLADGTKRLVSKTLHHFEELLDTSYFFRAHKSYLINLKEVKQYIKGESGEIILSNKMRIGLSRSKREAFLNLFARI